MSIARTHERNRTWQGIAIAVLATILWPAPETVAQPIFTTAPNALYGVAPTSSPAPAQPPAPAPARAANQAAQTAPGPVDAGYAAAQQRPPADAGQARPAQPRVVGAPQAPARAPVLTPAAVPAVAQQSLPAPVPSVPADPRVRPGINSAANSGAVLSVGGGTNREIGAVIRHLTNNIQGYRLSGEIAASEWPIYVTETQTRNRLRFQVGYLSAVSVMPEASILTLTINDTVVGRTNIRAVTGVRTIAFDVPEGLMKPGFNSVRLSAEQRHRVDCSLDATYELWTQIDPIQTGLVLPKADVGVTNLGDLAALPPDAQGALPIRAIVPSKTSASNIERIIRAVELISLVGRFEQPVVDIGPLADGEYGINLAIGTAAELATQITGFSASAITGARVIVLPAVPGRRTTIIVTGVSEDDVNNALNQFAVTTEMKGTPAGLRAAAAFPGFRMRGGQKVRLRDLGVPNQEFSGRSFRVGFNILMPPDFYAADYSKAMINLAGGYAPGLTNEAQIVVSINGRNAVSLRLAKSTGDVFRDNAIPLPLSYMRPGYNRVEIEARLPVASDTACDPIAAVSGNKRFLFLDSTEIEIPAIARIARMPDLAVTATGGFPFAGSELRPKLWVPAPDRASIGSAASLAAHLAIAAGRLIDFEFTVTRPDVGSGATLVIGPASSIDPGLMTDVGFKPDEVQAVWQDRITAVADRKGDEQLSKYEQMARNRLVLQRNFPAACHIPKPPGGYVRMVSHVDRFPTGAIPQDAADSADQTAAPPSLFDEWDTKLRGPSRTWIDFSGLFGRARAWIGSGSTTVRSFFGSIQSPFEQKPELPLVTRQASLLLGQNLLGDNRDSVWTVVTAPNSALLADAVGCLVDPRVWRQVAGRMAVLDASEGTVTNLPADRSRLIATQPFSVQNIRLIAASWFSINSGLYVSSAFAMALLLAFSTTWFVRNVGRKQD